ncbi:MAG: hypothetical protein QOH28_3992, partial [Actinomycetota bacterium]|nr:hypothetical protein [Actinomycetota bacterium]
MVPPMMSDPKPTSAPPELLPDNARLPIRPDGAAVVRGPTTWRTRAARWCVACGTEVGRTVVVV